MLEYLLFAFSSVLVFFSGSGCYKLSRSICEVYHQDSGTVPGDNSKIWTSSDVSISTYCPPYFYTAWKVAGGAPGGHHPHPNSFVFFLFNSRQQTVSKVNVCRVLVATTHTHDIRFQHPNLLRWITSNGHLLRSSP